MALRVVAFPAVDGPRGAAPAQPGAILFNTNPACLSTLGLLD